jgi:hypothetical protein
MIRLALLLTLASLLAHAQSGLTDRLGRACGDDVDTIEAASLGGFADLDVFYAVHLDGGWSLVPEEAVVTLHDYTGPPLLWRMQIVNGPRVIRCFVPEGK